LFGHSQQNVGAHSISAGGSPNAACGFPLIVPDCSLYDASGGLRCNATLTFSNATTDNVGFTLLQANPPVDTPGINCAIGNALGFACSPRGNCHCDGCNATAIANGQIYISNGNNLSQQVVDEVNQAVLRAGASGLYVDVPVGDSGGLTAAGCSSFRFNRDVTVAG